ncbi:MAG: SMP-30/gluconolactonase/LRE family protein [Phycisphaeraceae bacterium]|nr:SMP-30/gluconolactonase/LRE family protein [Phycisphaeraceae bacterium]
MQIDVLADYNCVCGENPLWHPSEKRVYWTDIDTGRLFWYEPATGKSEICWSDPKRKVGGFTIQADGSILLFMDRGTVAVFRDGRLTPLLPEIPREVDNRFNDVIADPKGRVFAGVMSSSVGKGQLYRIDPDLSYQVVQTEVGCSNGMGFTQDLKHMYYTDSWPHEIYAYDFDAATGSIANRRTIVAKPSTPDTCDGMTLDHQGNLWSAWWGAGYVRQFNPQGQELQAIKLPATRISSCVFGGDDLADLYLTTAMADKKYENDGALLRIRGLTAPDGKTLLHGLPEYRSCIGM